MTRRRALALVFGALALVFIGGSFVTLTRAQNQLIDEIDRDLVNQLDLTLQVRDSFAVEEFDDIVITENDIATIIVDRLGQVDVEVPAGPIDDPLPLPAVPPSRLIDRVGEVFSAEGVDGQLTYRVTVGRLDDGRFLALAAPLDAVHATIAQLARTLIVTLFVMMAVLGTIFWLLLRASLQPFDELVDTAEAIADGDMERRAAETTHPSAVRLTDSLNTMLDTLQRSFEQRQAAEDRVKQFAADASHELRTPITTVAGYSELYLSGAATDPASVHKQMTRINGEANRMGRLVNDLLTLARLDQGRGLDLQPIDVGAVVADAVADARVVDPSHTLHLDTSDDVHAVVGDGDALFQVFANLLANARVHAPESRVEASIATSGAEVTIRVTDDGPGINGEVIEHIFDRFYRSADSRTSDVRSSGLGLSIVASIVEAHGGTIGVESELGSGATFTVRLPSAPHDDLPPATG